VRAFSEAKRQMNECTIECLNEWINQLKQQAPKGLSLRTVRDWLMNLNPESDPFFWSSCSGPDQPRADASALVQNAKHAALAQYHPEFRARISCTIPNSGLGYYVLTQILRWDILHYPMACTSIVWKAKVWDRAAQNRGGHRNEALSGGTKTEPQDCAVFGVWDILAQGRIR